MEIGSGNRIREYVTIHRSASEGGATVIGNDNFLMSGVHCAHDTRVGNGTIIVNNTLLAGHVQVDDRAFLGGATLVHQHVRIGSLAITRGGTRLTKDVPPYFMAVAINQVSGINRLGLRRAGFMIPDRGRSGFQRHAFGFAATAFQHQQAAALHALCDAQVHVDVRRMKHTIDPTGCICRVE